MGDPNKYFETYEIDNETLKEMQQKMLEMLIYFKQFCQRFHLRFWLIGGGAIGAAREHGFVPWDDDVDIQMPRPDYEKFHKLWEKYGDKKRFKLCRTDRKTNYHHIASSLRDPNTTFICTYNKNYELCHGISLEFGAIDPTPDSKILQYIQIFWGFVFAIFNAQRLPNNRGGFARKVTKILYALTPSQKLKDDIWIYAEKQKSKYSWKKCHYVKELWGKTSFYNFPKEWFDSVVWVDFEGEKMPLPKGYHEYLTLIFGDYMKRPPVEQQVAKHDIVYIDMKNSYKKYRGIYYFPNNSSKK